MIEDINKSLNNNKEKEIDKNLKKEEKNQISLNLFKKRDNNVNMDESKKNPELNKDIDSENTQNNVKDIQNKQPKEKPDEKKKPKTLKEKYEDALNMLEKWEKKYMYLQAEMENSRKIMLKKLDITKYNSKVDSIKKFLPVIESLEAAITKIEKNTSNEEETAITPYLHGFRQVQKQFLQILDSIGVKPIEEENVPFNYREHEVMMKFEDDSKPEDTILNIVQKGWYINENILKPAKVIISKRKSVEKPKDEKVANIENSEVVEESANQLEKSAENKSDTLN